MRLSLFKSITQKIANEEQNHINEYVKFIDERIKKIKDAEPDSLLGEAIKAWSTAMSMRPDDAKYAKTLIEHLANGNEIDDDYLNYNGYPCVPVHYLKDFTIVKQDKWGYTLEDPMTNKWTGVSKCTIYENGQLPLWFCSTINSNRKEYVKKNTLENQSFES